MIATSGPAAALHRHAVAERTRRTNVRIVALLGLYLLALTAGEFAVTYVNPVLVFGIHLAIVGAILVAIGLTMRTEPDPPGIRRPAPWAVIKGSGPAIPAAPAGGTVERIDPIAGALLAPPLIRLISLTLPLAQLEPVWRYAAAGVPMLLCGLLVARAAGMTPRHIGIQWRRPAWQLLAVTLSVGLGFVEFVILRPAPLGALPWFIAGIGPALVLGISTGLPEELIFRGILQTAIRPVLGRFTVLYAATAFAVLHIGYRSLADFVFVFTVGAIYGVVFERSRSIIGTTVGHGVANVILFFVAPNLGLGLAVINLP